MEKGKFIVGLSIALFAVACNSATSKEEQMTNEVTATEEVVMEEEPEANFGKVINEKDAVGVSVLDSLMNGKDSVRVKIAAVATDVCAKKGCWMKVQNPDGSMMRITFKDYGFFVPKDITGKEVVFEGMAYQDTTSVDDLKHYAEDGGKSPEEIAMITEPEISTTFVADGVMIKQ